MTIFGMKELIEKLEVLRWTHMFLCPLPVMYSEAMLHFYKNFKVLKDSTMSSEVREVDLVLDPKLMGEILNVPVEDFDTYVRCE